MSTKVFTPNYEELPLFSGLCKDEVNEVLKKFHALIKHFPKSDPQEITAALRSFDPEGMKTEEIVRQCLRAMVMR